MLKPMLVGDMLTLKAHRNPDLIGMRSEAGTIGIVDVLWDLTAMRFTAEEPSLSTVRKRMTTPRWFRRFPPTSKHRL